MPRHLGHRPADLRKIVGPVWPPGSRDAEEVDAAEPGRLGEARGEPEPARGDVARKQTVKARLVKPGLARVQHFRLGLVDVHPEDLMTNISHAGCVHGPQVAAADH